MLDESEDLICTFQRSSSMPLLCKPTLVKSKLRRAVTDSPHSLNNIIEVGTVGGGVEGATCTKFCIFTDCHGNWEY